MGILGKIRRFPGHVLEWKRIVWDPKTDFSVPLLKKWEYALKGFSADESVWYDFDHHDWKDYISEWERLRSREINGAYKFILDNKLVFEEIFGKYTRVPENYAWIHNGQVLALHGLQVGNDNIFTFLLEKGQTILKWLDRGGGSGTYLFENREGTLFANGNPISEQELRTIVHREGEALLCEYITQSGFAASLYPYTTNTIRMACARKPGATKPELLAAVQRIGCKGSIPVDNLSSGGMVSQIDLETGMLTSCIAKLGKMENRLKPFACHPDTNAPIAGKVIPNWQQLKAEVVSLTEKVPYLNFVAWDVLLTKDGFCIIEGNASSGCALFQLEHGVRNSPLGDFYREYGVIK